MKELINQIKHNRIPKYEKYIIDVLGRLKIISNNLGVTFYGIDDINLIILSGDILSVKLTLLDDICEMLLVDETDLDIILYNKLSFVVKTTISKLFKEYVLDTTINKVETFGKTKQ